MEKLQIQNMGLPQYPKSYILSIAYISRIIEHCRKFKLAGSELLAETLWRQCNLEHLSFERTFRGQLT